MATRKRNVEIDIVVDDKKARAALRGVGDESTKTGDKFSKAAKMFAAVGAGAAIASFAQDSIRAFSELEQSIGGTEAVFGAASDAVDDFAATSAQSIGLAESEFRTATTSIGGQLKRMTGDVDFAAEHSIELTRVAADLAATYGGTTAEAVQALGSAFRGEADPAERFNLNLKVSKVNAKAVELGLADATTEVDDNARAQATLALITEQSADAQGQFAREIDTVAGQTQVAGARLEELKARIGEELAPTVVEGTDRLGNLFDALDEDVNLGWSQRLSAAFQTLLGESAESVAAYIEQKDAANDAADGADELTSRTAELSAGMDKARHPTKKVAEAIEEVEEQAVEATTALEDFEDEVRSQVDPLFALVEASNDLAEAQRDSDEARDEYKEGSPEHREALRQEAAKWLDLKEAQLRASEQSGLTRGDFERHLRAMAIFTEKEIDSILEDFDRVEAFKFSDKTIRVHEKYDGRGDHTYSGGRASGGPVQAGRSYTVGEEGPETLVMGSQSGYIVPNGGGGGSGGATVVQLVLDGKVLTQVVLDEMVRKGRRNGTSGVF